jgi:hypothetical protein
MKQTFPKLIPYAARLSSNSRPLGPLPFSRLGRRPITVPAKSLVFNPLVCHCHHLGGDILPRPVQALPTPRIMDRRRRPRVGFIFDISSFVLFVRCLPTFDRMGSTPPSSRHGRLTGPSNQSAANMLDEMPLKPSPYQVTDLHNHFFLFCFCR